MNKYYSLLLLFLLSPVLAGAQLTQWAFSVGGSQNDDGHICATAPNGNIYLAGSFSGTIDLDPSSAVYNLTSNGATDAFLACYTSSGNFLWGFSIGSFSTDGVESMAVDSNNNVIITGYFRGHNVDFNPSSSAVAYLSDQGTAGPNLSVGGDGFVAKYTSSGSYVWAIDLGGSSVFDIAEGVATDEVGNVYVGGDFHNTMDIDPSSSVSLLNAVTGTGYLIKYSPSGQLVWGFNLGGGGLSGIDNAVWSIIAQKGNVYITGCFQLTGDFDPSPATAYLTASGTYDGFLAKYDTAGNFKFVSPVSGSNEDQVLNLSFDAADNIYVTGFSSSPVVDFGNGAVSLPSPGADGKPDMFIARYTNNGQCTWAKIVGGKNDDVGYGIYVSDSTLYCTGYFHDTVDFDPSSAVYNLVAAGKEDGFLCKYNLDGDFLCGFSFGNSSSDNGRKLCVDSLGYIYMCGLFSSAVNFEPSGQPYILNSNGGTDAYLVKYKWGQPLPANGYLIGDTICAGAPAHLKFVATAGSAPYSIIYSNGTDSFTQNNIQSGQIISIDSPVLQTTTYTLLSVQGNGLCTPVAYPGSQVTVLVHPNPVAVVCNDTSICPDDKYQLYAAGGNSYYWYPSTGMDSPFIAQPAISLKNNVTYHVVVGNEYGCTDTGTVSIAVIPANFAINNAQNICIGDSVQLIASGGNEYSWVPSAFFSSDSIASPVVYPQQTTQYSVTIHEDLCNRSATLSTVIKVLPLPQVHITEVHDIDCGMKAGLLVATGAYSYQWSPTATLSDAHSASPVAHPYVATVYTVVGIDQNGCKNVDSATVHVFNDGTGRLFVPTAFTPNNDGKNDCFHIRMPGVVTDFKLIICNRWGQVVFETYNFDDCWDGTFGGIPQPIGTYYYYYRGSSSDCGSLKGKGDVTLIR